MRHVFAADEAGLVTRTGSVPDGAALPPGTVESVRPVSPTAHLVDGRMVERPALFPPEVAGNRLTWWGLPPGTSLRIEDVEVAAIITETEEHDILFEEPGTYVVFARPPAPWLPREVVVVVP